MPPTASMTHPSYRPDIDGLRAIAVLLVVTYHAFPESVTGGFVGVDVFFVISGYLISGIIFNNLDQKRFSFVEFYARRVKRIFPALMTMLAVVYLFGWLTLLPKEFKQLGGGMSRPAPDSSPISSLGMRSDILTTPL